MLTNLVGQIGCVTGLAAVIIIGIAFGAGWLVDGYLGNERKIATIIFMLGSFPITLFAMVKISLTMVTRAQERMEKLEEQEEQEREQIQP